MGDLVSPSMGTDLSNKAAATKHYHASSATKQPIFTKLHSAKSMSPTQQLPVKGVSVTLNQPEGRVSCQLQVEHGLPLKKLVYFYTSAKCILSTNKSTLVTRLVDGAVCFEGSRLIDKEDLLALRGCRPTSEEK